MVFLLCSIGLSVYSTDTIMKEQAVQKISLQKWNEVLIDEFPLVIEQKTKILPTDEIIHTP